MLFKTIGRYFIFLGALFTNREKFGTYYKLVLEECVLIGIGSIFLVVLVSTFMGAVTTVQTAYNMVSPLIPDDAFQQYAFSRAAGADDEVGYALVKDPADVSQHLFAVK